MNCRPCVNPFSVIRISILLLSFTFCFHVISPNFVRGQEEDPVGQSADEETDQEESKETDEAEESKVPEGLTHYMGRRIAMTMHFTGAEWLIRNRREREERCSMMLANLGLKPGMTVCDMGCGNGFHTLQIAKMLGDKGIVIGVDVQPQMLGFLRERMEKQGIDNVIPILGSYHHPRLPPNQVDLLLMVDVYHEFSHPEQMLASIRKSLKPNGQVVLVEFRLEDKTVPIKLLHKMSKAQVDKEMTANGFKLVRDFDGLPWQHMLFYGKDEQFDNATAESTKSSDETEKEK